MSKDKDNSDSGQSPSLHQSAEAAEDSGRIAEARSHSLSPKPGFFQNHPWLPFFLPLAVYMLIPSLFSAPAPGDHLSAADYEKVSQAYASDYFWMVSTRAALLVALPIFFMRALHLPRFRVSWLAILVGVVGVALWIGIDKIGVKSWLVAQLGAESWAASILGLAPRDAFNPIESYGVETLRFWWFLTARFIGLALIVPVVEELMLRGWLVRMVDNPEFWKVPFGVASRAAVITSVAFPMLYHPEKLPALVWFSLVTWLMLKTKNFWDCVAAHAVTNFLLGVWVVVMQDWELW